MNISWGQIVLMRREKIPSGKNLFFILQRLLKNPGFLCALPRQATLKVMLGLTYRCQCACSYCGCAAYDSGAPELATPTLARLITDIAALPCPFVCLSFFGGEPLLRDDIYALVAHAVNSGLFCEINTNGVLLNCDNVQKLRQSRLHHALVSIESPDPDRHDEIKNKPGAYRQALAGIRNCLAAGISCSLSKYVSKNDIANGEIAAVIQLGKELGVSGVRLLAPVAVRHWPAASPEEALTRDEQRQLRAYLDPHFVYWESTACNTATAPKRCAFLDNEFFYISPSGEVQPCPYLPVSFGNLTEAPLRGILREMRNAPAFAHAQASSCAAADPAVSAHFGRPSPGCRVLLRHGAPRLYA